MNLPNRFRSKVPPFVILIGLAVANICCGCATVPYQYGRFHPSDTATTEIDFEYGRPNKVVDGLAWCMSLWPRLLTMNSKLNLHELSDETKQKLVVYMDENDLNDVLVRVNQYDPIGEWRRLRQNDRVGPGWRYTIGVCMLAQYSLMPGRIWGGDQYNAYTNSLYINSDVPAVVLHEAAYAKDIHSRTLPGSYAFVNELPLIGMWRHAEGINDVLGYARTNDDWAIERETYSVVYPVIGIESTVLTEAVVPFWDGLLLSVAGAAIGHTAGQVAIYNRNKERQAIDGADSSDEEDGDPPIVQVNRKSSDSEDRKVRFSNHVDDMDEE